MKLLAAAGLGIVALFMLLGFLSSEASLLAPATMAALALTVVVPAAGAGLLVRSHFAERDRLSGRKALLRRQTLDAEILRLAGEQGGRLTALEVATHLALSPEDAKDSLNELARREHAELEVTDAGLIVYFFHDVRHLSGKDSAKGIFDA